MNQYHQVNYNAHFYCQDQENISQLKRGSCNKQIQGSNKKLKSIENTINSSSNQISHSLAKFEYRNERERRRVEKVNAEFKNLEETLLNANLIECSEHEKENCSSKARGLSKVKILRLALEYIEHLSGLLEVDSKMSVVSDHQYFNCLFSSQDIIDFNDYESFF